MLNLNLNKSISTVLCVFETDSATVSLVTARGQQRRMNLVILPRHSDIRNAEQKKQPCQTAIEGYL